MQAFLMTHSWSMELVAPWHMKFKMQMGIKGVVQIHRQFACQSDYLAFTRLHAKTSKPCTAESQGGCAREGVSEEVLLEATLPFHICPWSFYSLALSDSPWWMKWPRIVIPVLLRAYSFFAMRSLPPCHFCLSHRLVTLASQSEPACVRHHPNECRSSQVPLPHKQGSCSSVGERGKVDASIMSNNSV